MGVASLRASALPVAARVRARVAAKAAIPLWGPVTIVASATLIEQYGYSVGIPGLDAFTDRIPLYASFQGAFGVNGLVVTPMDLLLGVLVAIGICRGLQLRRTAVSGSIGMLAALAAIAAIRGILGATDKAASDAALLELRPWLYLGLAFVIAFQAVRGARARQAVLWTFVLGTGFKSIQGVYIYFMTRSLVPLPSAILAHEESVFFAIFITLTLGLWLFGQRGRLRTVATFLLPAVVLADLANNRRTGVLILGAQILVLGIVAYMVLPERRRLVRRVAAGALVTLTISVPVYWNDQGTLGVVAQTVRTAIGQPDPRNLSSDQYRLAENANLGHMIQLDPLFGTGFGVPVADTVPIANITALDSMIAYEPHNGVLYMWMRMGLPGELVLWMFVASAVLLGVRASQAEDRQVAVFGTLVAASAVGWTIMCYLDMGYSNERIALAMGVLLGAISAVDLEFAQRSASRSARQAVDKVRRSELRSNRLRPLHDQAPRRSWAGRARVAE